MQAALIPPRGLETYVLQSSFHLALAIPDTVSNSRYTSTYRRAAARDDHIIVDNGAADGGLVDNRELLLAAAVLGANEIVAPDVLFDKAQTVVKVADFLSWYKTEQEQHYNVMAVAQGVNKLELQKCIDRYSTYSTITAVGLPRHLLTTLKLASARIDLANWVEEMFPGRFKIHLLGTNTSWIREVEFANKYAPHIRSVDSALPFNYALSDIDLKSTKAAITRHKDYFKVDWLGRAKLDLVQQNINTFLRWSGATIAEEARAGKL